MSLWICADCGKMIGGSRGCPQCITCGSLNVGRVSSNSGSASSYITVNNSDGLDYVSWDELDKSANEDSIFNNWTKKETLRVRNSMLSFEEDWNFPGMEKYDSM